jgi:hypothetical protein
VRSVYAHKAGATPTLSFVLGVACGRHGVEAGVPCWDWGQGRAVCGSRLAAALGTSVTDVPGRAR